jgi:hypothetical protein
MTKLISVHTLFAAEETGSLLLLTASIHLHIAYFEPFYDMANKKVIESTVSKE